MRSLLLIISLLVFKISYAGESLKEEDTQPLYETGFFIAGLTLHDYPASDQSRVRTIPLPLIHYHGDLFRSDDKDGTRFRFINNENIDFDLSFGGSFPTETDKTQARLGMPELDWTGEIGPRLLYYIYRNKDIAQIRIGLPLRASFATNFTKLYTVGYVFAPLIQINKYNFLFNNLDLYFDYTFITLDEGQADYFYQIDKQYETNERKFYDAGSGTLGYDIDLAFKYKWHNKTIFTAARYSDYSQSANTASYLHRANINWSFIVGLSWVFFESEERVIKL